MKTLTFAAILMFTPMLAQAWPWSHDMANQISIKSQGSPGFLHNRTPTLNKDPGMQIFPTRSVPVPAISVTMMPDRETAELQKNPIPVTEQSLKTGRELFAIICTPCHGFEGRGDGIVGNKFALQPFDLTSDADGVTDRSEAFIWSQITFGGVFMPVYANDLSPEERWHIVNFVRNVLQKLPKKPVETAVETSVETAK